MNTALFFRGSIALLALWTTCAVAAPLKPAQKNSMAEKYSDRGAKPGRGAVGTAQLSGRALVDKDGKTRIDLSTGGFDGGAPTGTLEKVQVRVFVGDKLVGTDNYNHLGGGTANIDYSSLARGQRIALQANVKGGARGRTEIVSLDTTVMRRPDVAAVEVTVPDQVAPGSTHPVTAIVEEKNGDVGARFDCQMLVNDVPQYTISNAWVDAGSRVACRFTANFPSPGEARVSVRVSNMAPADDSAGNDMAYALVDVAPQPFDSAYASYYWSRSESGRGYWQFSRSIFGHTDSFSEGTDYPSWYQNFGANARMNGAHPVAGTLRLRHWMDGRALPDMEVDLSQLVVNDWGCLQGWFEGAVAALACAGPDYLEVGANVIGGIAIYFGDGWYGAQPWFLEGNDYRVEISIEGPTLSRRSTIDVRIPPQEQYGSREWSEWMCRITSVGYWGNHLIEAGVCERSWNLTTTRYGLAFAP